MKIRNKSPVLKKLIIELNEKGKDSPFWKSIAKYLNKPRRKLSKVNLFKINKHANSNDTIIVPGYVLGTGELKKPVTIIALKFSKTAEEKIKKIKGKCLYISEFVKKNPKISNIKIIG